MSKRRRRQGHPARASRKQLAARLARWQSTRGELVTIDVGEYIAEIALSTRRRDVMIDVGIMRSQLRLTVFDQAAALSMLQEMGWAFGELIDGDPLIRVTVPDHVLAAA